VELLTAGQVTALAGSITPELEVAIWIGAGAGLRISETLGLTVDRIDFLRRRLRVDRQLYRGELVEPKTAASRRTIPLDDFVVAKIAKHLESGPRGPKLEPGPILLITSAGRPVHRSTFGDHWRAAVRAAGLPPTSYHSLRHFYASALIRSGLSVKEVQSRLGHSSAMITLDVYAHLWEHEEDRGRGAIEAMFSMRAEQDSSTSQLTGN
jgi:integrase